MDRIVTFRECAEDYLAAPTKRSGKRKKQYTIDIVNELIARWGDIPIKEFERKYLLTKFFGELAGRNNRWTGEPVSNGFVNNYRTYCRAVLIHARDELEFIDRVPKFENLPEEKRELYLTPKQCRELMRWLDELRADMVEFALCCGQRNKTIRLLKWASISEDYTVLHLAGKDAKNGLTTSFALNKDAQRILKRRWEIKQKLEKLYPYLVTSKPKGIEYVFVQEHRSVRSNGKPFSQTSLTNDTWRRAVLNAGLPKGVVFHTLRHTFASWHIMSGTGERTLMDLGGWVSPKSMLRYTHLNHEHKAKAASKLEGMVRRSGLDHR
jgi:integrase|tara:strand:+ start:11 stop:979 length:969 start_codon:yes stop_codon:yes gene_type:complete